jgi:RHS repeat-associated protein
MNSTKRIIVFALLSLIQISVLAQSVITLNAPETGAKIHEANQKVVLSNGYKYTAAGASKMKAYINPNLLGSASYSGTFYNDILQQHAINTQHAVGVTQGNASVSASGGASYSIPFSLPEGTMGMVPTVGIDYNSQGGNGLLGMGWNLSAFSVVTRTGQTIYHDGKTEGIEMNNSDVFVLDGMRLIPLTGNNGEDGTEYATEQESFSRVTSLGTSGTGPLSFLVETKDGKTIEYGTNDQSQLKEINGNTVIVWYIKKVTDLNDNYMEYFYRAEDGEVLLDEIKYTGNSATNLIPYNKIKFFYSSRNDKNTTYILGKEVKNNVVLDRVQISGDNLLFREYQFKYAFNLHSFLTEVIEIGSDGSRFNSTVFQYGEQVQSQNIITTSTPSFPAEAADVYVGDYTGDGISDVLAAYPRGGVYHLNVKLFAGSSSGTFTNIYNKTLSEDEAVFVEDPTRTSNNYYRADFNGDGKNDFVLWNKSDLISEGNETNAPYYWNLNSFKIFTSTGNSFTEKEYFVNSNHNQIRSDNLHSYAHVGDFDGDGAIDLLTILANDNSHTNEIAIYFPVRNEVRKMMSTLPACNVIYVSDVDGDGKNELFLEYVNTIIAEFRLLPNNALSISTQITPYPSIHPFHTDMIMQGDFNGDGKSDLLSTIAGQWTVDYSKGKVLNEELYDRKTIGIAQNNQYGVKVNDYNGDGKSDIIIMYSYPVPKINVRYSNGFGFSEPVDVPIADFQTVNMYSGDFNGDGSMDELYLNGALPNTFRLHLFNKDHQQFLLKKAADGFNNIQEFSYKPITNPHVYASTQIAAYPLNILSFPYYVVSSHKQPNGNGGANETTYKYEDAVMHKQGKGFLGFLKTASFNIESDRKVIAATQLNLTNGFYTPDFHSTSLFQLSSGMPLSVSTESYTCSPLGGKRHWFFVNSSTSHDAIIGVYTSISNEYNNSFGNISKVTTLVNDQISNSNPIQLQVKEFTYGQFGTWIPSHPISTKTTSTRVRDGETPYIRTSNFNYYGNGNVLSQINDLGDAKQVTTAINQYNNLGQALSQTTSAASVPSITTSVEFDTKGRVVKKYNALLQYERITYGAFSRVSTSTDIAGLVTQYSYDGFGRLIKTKQPTGVEVYQNLNWQINVGSNSSVNDLSTVYSSTTSVANTPTTQTWFDAMGREKKTKLDRLASAAVFTEKAYNNLGQEAWKSSPHFTSETPILTTNEYNDFLHRVSKTTIDGITPTTYVYVDGQGKSTVTTTSPQGTNTTITDATGLTFSSQDDGGELKYKYYSSGNLKSVELASTIMVSLEYDLLGNKTKMIDKNAGTIEYSYDAYGRLLSQNDNGKNITMQYDIAGRLSNKTTAEGTTTYEYYSDGKALNAIKKIIGVGGMQQQYAYSSDFGRLLKLDELVGSDLFTTQFEYDNFGNQTKMIYPSNFAIKKHYNNVGEMYKITDNTESTTIWQRTSVNALGQYTEYTTGNGKTTKTEYDVYGLPKRISATGLIDLQTTFDANSGNLTSRKDNLLNHTESFTYDASNRLKTAQVNSLAIQSVDYANNGNITQKTGVGDYTYDQNKINAVSKITPPLASDLFSSVISQEDQLIEYSSFNKAKKLTENGYELTISYGVDDQRRKGEIKQGANVILTRYYLSQYEKTIEGANTTEINYISSPDGMVAVYAKENGTGSYHYIYKDHLGTPVVVTNSAGVVEYKQNFDAWGRKRNPNTWDYDMTSYTTTQPKWLYRGYTGHEHLPQFTLINMNGRMYDPVVGRMLSSDNYIQAEEFSQCFNRYSYCVNNPLKYKDPSGNSFMSDFSNGVGNFMSKLLGSYNQSSSGTLISQQTISKASSQASSIAEASFKAAVAQQSMMISIATGGLISNLAIPFANTFSIIGSSLGGSVYEHIYSGADITMSLGVASYNFSKGTLGYFGKMGNSVGDDIGYFLGGLANTEDILAGFNPGKIELRTEYDINYDSFGTPYDLVGHSQINEGGEVLIDWGPKNGVSGFFDWDTGINNYEQGNLIDMMIWTPIDVEGVNIERLRKFSNFLNNGGRYNLLASSCVTQTSRALNISGVFNIGIHPYFLSSQMYMRSIGIRPLLYGYLLQNNN